MAIKIHSEPKAQRRKGAKGPVTKIFYLFFSTFLLVSAQSISLSQNMDPVAEGQNNPNTQEMGSGTTKCRDFKLISTSVNVAKDRSTVIFTYHYLLNSEGDLFLSSATYYSMRDITIQDPIVMIITARYMEEVSNSRSSCV